ncbi:hypothetical protein ACFXPS_43675 [Nocardia sp. NPDC059091]|uniref:hypothetical protein n=1 Tax=Nocardia sp. NPDC059091 TaxID=3346724 RepID=UPI0036CDF142
MSTDQLEHILALGHAQGSLREDATGMDITVLVSEVARAFIDLGIRDADVWRRYARLALAAVRALAQRIHQSKGRFGCRECFITRFIEVGGVYPTGCGINGGSQRCARPPQ